MNISRCWASGRCIEEVHGIYKLTCRWAGHLVQYVKFKKKSRPYPHLACNCYKWQDQFTNYSFMGFYAHQGTADKCRLSWMTTLAACSPSTAKSSNLGKWWQMSILYICCPKFRTEPIVWIILAWMFPVNPHFFSAWSGLVISSHDFAHKSHSSRLTFSFPGMDFWRDSSVQDLTWQPARWKPRETGGNWAE